MAKTMIQIQSSTRDKIKSLGKMGETYDDVLQRLYTIAEEHILAQQLLDTSDCVSLKDVLKKRNLI